MNGICDERNKSWIGWDSYIKHVVFCRFVENFLVFSFYSRSIVIALRCHNWRATCVVMFAS